MGNMTLVALGAFDFRRLRAGAEVLNTGVKPVLNAGRSWGTPQDRTQVPFGWTEILLSSGQV